MATFILTMLVIIAGGVVRMTQSGMGCPDWPRCFGKWIPPTNASELPADFERYLSKQDIDHSFNAYHTWIEYFNRLLGVLLGLFAIIQCFVVYRKRKAVPRVWSLAKGFLFIVILTGLFGALVVRYNLAHLSITIHLVFAILLVQIQLALILDLQQKLGRLSLSPELKRLLIGFLSLLIIQASLGTIVRMYVDDISKELLYEKRETWLVAKPVSFLIHRTFSWFVLLATFYLSWRGRYSVVKKQINWILVVILCEMATGIVLYYADVPALAQPLHLLLATIVITQTCSLLLQAKRKFPALT